jgi:predicted ATPase
LEALVKQHQRLLEAQGNIVVVTGEAGLGKSRLITEFRSQVDENGVQPAQPLWLLGRDRSQLEKIDAESVPPLWLFGRGLSYRQSFKNRLFVDILHSYLDLPESPDDTLVKMRLELMGEKLFGPRQNDIVPYLALLLGLSLDEEQKTDLPLDDPQILQQRTFVALGEWVEMLATNQPLIMVFEDLHWADPSSVQLIEYLFSLTVYQPILMICATRPERESNFWGVKLSSHQDYKETFSELTLWPLTDAESRQLTQQQHTHDKMPLTIEHLI